MWRRHFHRYPDLRFEGCHLLGKLGIRERLGVQPHRQGELRGAGVAPIVRLRAGAGIAPESWWSVVSAGINCRGSRQGSPGDHRR
jgi:hypothetical protein